jgi:hypothetical protein
MSRGIRWSIGATLAAGLTACRMQSPGGRDGSWTRVHEQTSCEALNRSYCAGVYGFTLMNDGRYTVGPAVNGAQINGALSDLEWAQLSSDAALVAGGLGGSPECDPAGTVPGVGDFVDMTDARDVVSRVYERSVRSTCYRGGRSRAVRLHADLIGLMAKYYPRPFPP